MTSLMGGSQQQGADWSLGRILLSMREKEYSWRRESVSKAEEGRKGCPDSRDEAGLDFTGSAD